MTRRRHAQWSRCGDQRSSSSSTLSPVTAHNLWTPGGLRQGVQEETIYFPPAQPSTGYVVIRQKINFLHDVKKSPITVWPGAGGHVVTWRLQWDTWWRLAAVWSLQLFYSTSLSLGGHSEQSNRRHHTPCSHLQGRPLFALGNLLLFRSLR